MTEVAVMLALVKELGELESRILYLETLTKSYPGGYRRGFYRYTDRIRTFVNFRAGGFNISKEPIPEWLNDVMVSAMLDELDRLRDELSVCVEKVSRAGMAVSFE